MALIAHHGLSDQCQGPNAGQKLNRFGTRERKQQQDKTKQAGHGGKKQYSLRKADVILLQIFCRELLMLTPAFHPHDHSHCVHDALATADQLCANSGARLTPLRRRVLELVWNSHQPLGAYELLNHLTAEGHKPAPPTVYRALEFLLEQKLVHRIASRNAFIGCSHPGSIHSGYFLLCESCGNAEEIAVDGTLGKAVAQAAAASEFSVRAQTLELTGLCRHCQNQQREAAEPA
jgi:Fur family zinc uptake transcriptional regulator